MAITKLGGQIKLIQITPTDGMTRNFKGRIGLLKNNERFSIRPSD
jgi:hypothetical protein